jgi:hypothetical protein
MDAMGMWVLLGIVAVVVAGTALLVPHARSIDVPGVQHLAYDAAGDMEFGADARRAATRVMTPIALSSIVVTVFGLVLQGAGAASAVTTFIGLVLACLSILAGHIAARRAVAAGRIAAR